MRDKIVTILLGNPRYFTPTVADCHWSEEPYYTGEFPPHYPVPAVLTMNDEQGRKYSAYRWMENFDGFWSETGPRCRSFSF